MYGVRDRVPRRGRRARRAVSGGEDKTLLVWDLDKGGAPLLKLVGHTGYVNTIACHGESDDWCIVSGSNDGTVRLWDGAAGAVYLLGSRAASVAARARAGEVDVFAAVDESAGAPRAARRPEPAGGAHQGGAARRARVCLIWRISLLRKAGARSPRQAASRASQW